jgi:hypothetical protein
MASYQTPDINALNVYSVRAQIAMKKSSDPFEATVRDSRSVLTDYDTFPYPRWYRGDYNSSNPIVAEREAGWRQRADACYTVNHQIKEPGPYPNHCFEAACSTVYPCYPKYLSKEADRNALNLILNGGCVAQYR